jgi:hypothetical protein
MAKQLVGRKAWRLHVRLLEARAERVLVGVRIPNMDVGVDPSGNLFFACRRRTMGYPGCRGCAGNASEITSREFVWFVRIDHDCDPSVGSAAITLLAAPRRNRANERSKRRTLHDQYGILRQRFNVGHPTFPI